MATQTTLSLKTIAAFRSIYASPHVAKLQEFWATPLPPDHPLTPHINQEKIQKASKALAVQSLCCFTKLFDHLCLARLLSKRLKSENSQEELWAQKVCESEAIVAMLETFYPWFTDELLLITETFLHVNTVKGTVAPAQLFLQFYCERLLDSFTVLEEDAPVLEEDVEEIFQKGQELLASGAPLTLPTF